MNIPVSKDEKRSQKAHIQSIIGKYISAWRIATEMFTSDTWKVVNKINFEPVCFIQQFNTHVTSSRTPMIIENIFAVPH